MIPSQVPTVDVTAIRGTWVTIACCYCGGTHRHEVDRRSKSVPQWRGPICGLYRSGDDRMTGYQFTANHSEDIT